MVGPDAGRCLGERVQWRSCLSRGERHARQVVSSPIQQAFLHFVAKDCRLASVKFARKATQEKSHARSSCSGDLDAPDDILRRRPGIGIPSSCPAAAAPRTVRHYTTAVPPRNARQDPGFRRDSPPEAIPGQRWASIFSNFWPLQRCQVH